MIGRLTGILVEKSPPTLCLDVNGLGYDIDVPMSTLYTLPDIGLQVSLYTHLTVREDAHLLYGFATLAERVTFRELIKVGGIGARMALAILSGLSVTDLIQAITQQESDRLTRVPGIGKKTAARLLLELRGKLGENMGVLLPHAPPDKQSDMLHALLALGYSEKESLAALKNLPDNVSIADGIRQALKNLVR
jgi:Holliday junction DNA helicase RuvA